MTGSVVSNKAVYSKFTFSLLYDTGWYDVDFAYAEEIVWGKNQGCDFYTDACLKEPKFAEFSDEYSDSTYRECNFD